MSLIDELSKLEEMHRRGTLSDSEFALAKQRLLSNPGTAPMETGSGVENHLSEQLSEIRYQNDLAALDREWEIESRSYYIRDKNGQMHLPTESNAWVIQWVGVPFGIVWTIMAVAITSSAPNEGPFSIAKIIFPLFGLGFIIGAIVMGNYVKRKASEYQAAYQRYRKRRAQFTNQTDDDERIN